MRIGSVFKPAVLVLKAGARLHKYLVVVICILFCSTLRAEFLSEQGEVLNDPTKPHRIAKVQTIKASPVPSFKLGYILSSGQQRHALINGTKVKQGDLVSGARVLSINARAVELSLNGERITLKLKRLAGITRK